VFSGGATTPCLSKKDQRRMAVVSPTSDLDGKASATDLLQEADFSRKLYPTRPSQRDSVDESPIVHVVAHGPNQQVWWFRRGT
jgi:hypothetical protein